MSLPLFTIAKLANYRVVFNDHAIKLGFQSASEVEQFIFHVYNKSIRTISAAERPRGAVFVLKPPHVTGSVASVTALKAALLSIAAQASDVIHSLPVDLTGLASVIHTFNPSEKLSMVGSACTQSFAQMISKDNYCVVWANGVGVNVFMCGDIFIESPDVVELLPASVPARFEALSWDDGEIVFEFARLELNDTTPAGIWRLPDKNILQPKPEKLMSIALGKFLRNRLAGYRHHDDEPYVENEGRADISLHTINGQVFIIEVKWVGHALSGPRAYQTDSAIESAIQKKLKSWITKYGDDTFVSGTKQLGRYFTTGKYDRAYLAVFDCAAPDASRCNGVLPVDPTHVTPHSIQRFKLMRACADPRKASVISKSKVS